THRYGRGRAIALAAQDVWLWRMHAAIPVEDATHATLWRQLLRWLLEEVPDRAEMTISPEHPAPGQRVTVRVELADSGFVRVNDAAVTAELTTPDVDVRSIPLEWTLG